MCASIFLVVFLCLFLAWLVNQGLFGCCRSKRGFFILIVVDTVVKKESTWILLVSIGISSGCCSEYFVCASFPGGCVLGSVLDLHCGLRFVW